MRKIALLTALALAGSAGPAAATLMLAGDVSGVGFSCVDQAACDSNLAVGSIGLGTSATPFTVNGVNVFASLHIQDATSLASSSLEIINTSGLARTISLTVGGTGFAGPVGSFTSSGAGQFLSTIGSTIALAYFLDSANGQGAESVGDTPGISVTPFNAVADANPYSFAHNGGGAFVAAGPFSMTMSAVATLDGDGRLVSRGQSIVVAAVPEPASLGLFGLGLLGLGWAARRRAG